eukprot:CAMPEP_0198314020 /NCGR_PEP_ID=MMETSP1450-20131203/4850_1 /TAXON_ID=753684 ORGANISM="Madagascaria erythrocladiodes, Strain CCMP3234" /NCGR_SAMPLE_ID=MMETSP1450 /ASSEMBLY_ACC=CAM_ASM_001115 /LENGTH=267 /DNA_ID=CAMNT_0044017057 /DNA_START=75 /DNA_END=874 /DNA_ORIENTATION=-
MASAVQRLARAGGVAVAVARAKFDDSMTNADLEQVMLVCVRVMHAVVAPLFVLRLVHGWWLDGVAPHAVTQAAAFLVSTIMVLLNACHVIDDASFWRAWLRIGFVVTLARHLYLIAAGVDNVNVCETFFVILALSPARNLHWGDMAFAAMPPVIDVMFGAYGNALQSLVWAVIYALVWFVVRARQHLLTDTIDELRAERDKQTRFVANASHELRTPLHAIIALHEELAHSGVVQEHHAAALSTLTESSDTLLSLVNRLLDLAHLDER